MTSTNSESSQNPIVPTSSTAFTVGNHLSQSWHRLKLNIWKIVGLYILVYISYFVVGAIIALFAGITFYTNSDLRTLFSNLVQKSDISWDIVLHVIQTMWLPVTMFVVFAIVIFTLISLIYSGTLAVFLSEPDKKTSFSVGLKKGFRKSPALLIMSLLSFLLVLGGWALFIIPGIIISLLLSFTFYEIVLADRKIFSAMRRSVYLVSSQFSLYFGRAVLIFVFYVILIVITSSIQSFLSLPSFFGNTNDAIKLTKSLLDIIYNLFSIVFTIFIVSYSVVLYQEIVKRSDNKKEGKFNWMVVVALIGWLIILLAGYGFSKLAVSAIIPAIKSEIENSNKSDETSSNTDNDWFTNEIPSSCGLTVRLPKTVDTESSETRMWIYEERFLDPKSLWDLISQKEQKGGVLAGYLNFKTNAQRFKDTDTVFTSYTGPAFYCTANPDKLTLDQLVERARSSKVNTVKTSGEKKMFGELEFQPIQVEGLLDGDFYSEPFYIAVSKDGNRLIFIKIWAPSNNDALQKALDLDTTRILATLQAREVPSAFSNTKITETTSTNTNANTVQKTSCTKYKIYEGEFASDKCYSSQDYQDLQYYLQRYDSAVFSYNGAISSMNITCSGSDFFKDACEKDKKQKEDAEKQMADYKNTINSIIARGK